MDTKEEMLYALSANLLTLGILGFVHNPLFGMFYVSPFQNILYIASSMYVFWYAIHCLTDAYKYAKHIAIIFFLTSIFEIIPNSSFLSFVLKPSIADSFLNLFLSLVFLYIYLSRNRKKELGLNIS